MKDFLKTLSDEDLELITQLAEHPAFKVGKIPSVFSRLLEQVLTEQAVTNAKKSYQGQALEVLLDQGAIHGIDTLKVRLTQLEDFCASERKARLDKHT